LIEVGEEREEAMGCERRENRKELINIKEQSRHGGRKRSDFELWRTRATSIRSQEEVKEGEIESIDVGARSTRSKVNRTPRNLKGTRPIGLECSVEVFDVLITNLIDMMTDSISSSKPAEIGRIAFLFSGNMLNKVVQKSQVSGLGFGSLFGVFDPAVGRLMAGFLAMNAWSTALMSEETLNRDRRGRTVIELVLRAKIFEFLEDIFEGFRFEVH